MILIYLLTSYLLTIFLHELSHVLMASFLVGVESFRIRPYPHTLCGALVSASVRVVYKREPTEAEEARVAFAPRYFDLLCCALFLMTSNAFLFVLSLGGLLDLFLASQNKGHSDLYLYSKYYGLDLQETKDNHLIFLIFVVCLKVVFS